MKRINEQIDMEFKAQVEQLHARFMEETALSEARMKELEVRFEVEKRKLVQQELQQKAIFTMLGKGLAAKMQHRRKEAATKLRHTERIPIWNSGGYANSTRGFQMACKHISHSVSNTRNRKRQMAENYYCVIHATIALCVNHYIGASC